MNTEKGKAKAASESGETGTKVVFNVTTADVDMTSISLGGVRV